MNKHFFFLLITTFSLIGFAQQTQYSGTVIDGSNQEPLLGASIIVKGTNVGTTSDLDGKYNITANSSDILIISYLGYLTKEIPVSSDLIVTLEEDVASLDQIVVVGYGTQAKREITGAVTVVKAETIESLKPTRIEQALQGQVAGVNVTSTSGSPGAASNIRIRGISTNGDNRPLILVDGNVVEDLSVINPGDIESYTVLKDATAGIYGVRAANGVILITTKGGRKNQKLQYEYDAFVGFQQTTRKLPTLNSKQYALLVNEAFANNGETPPFSTIVGLNDTDWQGEVFSNAPIFNNNIGLRGGTEKAAYAFGAALLTQDGIVGAGKSNFTRSTLRFNFDYDLLSNLKVKTGLFYTGTSRSTISETGLGSVLFNAVNNAPTFSVRDANGDFTLAEGLGNEVINPVHQLENTFNSNKVDKISGNFGLNYKFWDDFTVETRIQFNYAEAYGDNFAPEANYGSGKVFNLTRNVYGEYSNYFRDYTYDAFINYKHTFAQAHNLNATVGMSAFRTTGKFNGLTGFDIPDNSFSNANRQNASDIVDNFQNGGDEYDARLLSHFARLQYDYDGKYLFSGVIRRDGSTKFGPENKFGIFPSASAGWVLSKESFLEESKSINFLKLRGSYGITGNDRIPDYRFISLLNGEGAYVIGDNLIFGTAIGAISNPEIKWEEQYTADIGLEAEFLDYKLNVTIDYYTRRTEDLLLVPVVSGTLGVTAPGSSAPVINGGDIENKGLEFAISYKDKINDNLSFTASYNFATLKNEVLKVNNSVGFLEGGSFGVGQPAPSRMEVGKPIGYFYGYRTDGIFQDANEVASHPSQLALGAIAQPGDIRYVDINEDGVINLEDRTDLGNPIPDVTMGLNLSVNYKNWDVQTYLYASIGNDVVRNYERNQNLTNLTTNYLDRWTGPGTSNSTPRVTTGATSNQVFSDFYVEDGSFLRAQNMQVGYTITDATLDTLKIKDMRFYVSVNNLFTLTKYRGFDPSASDGAPIGGGIDYGFYPVPRTFLAGVNLKF
ncbi:MAG: TonB-dependent receptor [Nonlabens ulvanivorans]